MTMARFKEDQAVFGARYLVSAYLVRKTVFTSGGWSDAKKEWQRAVLPDLRPGVLIGLRTVSNGRRVSLGDEGIAYKAESYIRVALVAFDLHSKPALVLLTDLYT